MAKEQRQLINKLNTLGTKDSETRLVLTRDSFAKSMSPGSIIGGAMCKCFFCGAEHKAEDMTWIVINDNQDEPMCDACGDKQVSALGLSGMEKAQSETYEGKYREDEDEERT